MSVSLLVSKWSGQQAAPTTQGRLPLKSGTVLHVRPLTASKHVFFLATPQGELQVGTIENHTWKPCKVAGVPLQCFEQQISQARHTLHHSWIQERANVIQVTPKLLGGFPFIPPEEYKEFVTLDVAGQIFQAGGTLVQTVEDDPTRLWQNPLTKFFGLDGVVDALLEGKFQKALDKAEPYYDLIGVLSAGWLTGPLKVRGKVLEDQKYDDLAQLIFENIKANLERCRLEFDAGGLSAGTKGRALAAIRKLEAFQVTAGDLILHDDDWNTQLEDLKASSKKVLEEATKLEKDERRFEGMVAGTKIGVNLFSQALALSDPKLARRVQTIGQGAVTVAESVHKLRKLTSKSDLINFVEPVGAIIQVGMLAIALICEEEGPDPLQVISEQIAEVSKAVAEVHRDMHTRFERVETLLGTMYQEMMGEFVKVHESLHRIETLLSGFAQSTTRELFDLHRDVIEGNQAIFTCGLEAALEGVRHQSGVADITKQGFLERREIFLVWGNHFAFHKLLTGDQGALSFEAPEVQKTLSRSPEAAINYLRAYYQTVTGEPIERLVNLDFWCRAVEGYMLHRAHWDEKTRSYLPPVIANRVYSPHTESYLTPAEAQSLQGLLAIGKKTQAFLQKVATSAELFDTLLDTCEKGLALLAQGSLQELKQAIDTPGSRLYATVQEVDKSYLLIRGFAALGFHSSFHSDMLFRLALQGTGESPYTLLSKEGMQAALARADSRIHLRKILSHGQQAARLLREMIRAKVTANRENTAQESHGMLAFTCAKLGAFMRHYYPGIAVDQEAPSLLPHVLTSRQLLPEDPHHQARVGNLAALKRFVEQEPTCLFKRDVFGRTPGHCAAQGGHRAAFEFLVSQGAPLTARDLAGDTPLHFAAKTGLLEGRAPSLTKPRNHFHQTPLDESSLFTEGVNAWKQGGERSFQIGGCGQGAHVHVGSEVIVRIHPRGDQLHVFDAGSGKLLWQAPGGAYKYALKAMTYLNYVLFALRSGELKVHDACTGEEIMLPQGLSPLPGVVKGFQVHQNTLLVLTHPQNPKGNIRTTISVYKMAQEPQEWALLHREAFVNRCSVSAHLCDQDRLCTLIGPVANSGNNFVSSLSFRNLVSGQGGPILGNQQGGCTPLYSYKERFAWMRQPAPQPGKGPPPPGQVVVCDTKTGKQVHQLGPFYYYGHHAWGPFVAVLAREGGNYRLKILNLETLKLVTDTSLCPFESECVSLAGDYNIVAFAQGKNLQGAPRTFQRVILFNIETGEKLHTQQTGQLPHGGGIAAYVAGNQVFCQGGALTAFRFPKAT